MAARSTATHLKDEGIHRLASDVVELAQQPSNRGVAGLWLRQLDQHLTVIVTVTVPMHTSTGLDREATKIATQLSARKAQEGRSKCGHKEEKDFMQLMDRKRVI